MKYQFLEKNNFVLLLITMLIIQSCTQVSKEGKTESEQISEVEAAAPLVKAEYDSLIKFRRDSFSIQVSNQHQSPVFIDPVMEIEKFTSYIEENNPQKAYDGVRIAPGFKDGKVFLMVCLAKKNDSAADAKYMILNESDYTGNISLPEIDDLNNMAEVKNCFKQYFDKVWIRNNHQVFPAASGNDTLKYSRFYELSEVDSLVKHNLSNNPVYFKFETGYISIGMASFLKERYTITPTYTENQVKGFTVIWSLLNDKKVQILDPAAIYRDPEVPNRYKGVVLEVGHPCPPRCGNDLY